MFKIENSNMNKNSDMKQKKLARLAGFYYLINVILSVFYMEYLPSQIVVWGDAEATMSNLLNNEMLYRFGVIAGIFVHISFIMLPLTLYRLLNHINKQYAIVMVLFALISVPISFTLLIDQIELIGIVTDYSSLDITGQTGANLKAITFFERLTNGFFLCQTFWGLWLFPFGYLVFKSGFLPKFLGVALMLGCITYMIDVVGGVMFSNYYEYFNTRILIIPAAIGEIGMCLWLLIVGVKANIKF
ncbi:DUF4386 domain-containing protein [Kordia sp. YSTF-M3]|uniref:DUF4386 domain-containing protein n=1 Tax=Kordia aestuariivivens TaxID=2759037 RepID=A0ABR7QBL1_9FLAO|nr:DUF4386 domain-containing protein [Kordia aestuariivivens]MBC8755955.1 DUF4386 domain-containing protein [Kordia aestuariivivens]